MMVSQGRRKHLKVCRAIIYTSEVSKQPPSDCLRSLFNIVPDCYWREEQVPYQWPCCTREVSAIWLNSTTIWLGVKHLPFKPVCSRVQDMFHSVQLNVNNPHFLIMQGRINKVGAVTVIMMMMKVLMLYRDGSQASHIL